MDTWKISLCFFNFRFEFLESSWVFFQINIIFLLENFSEMFSQFLVKIFSSKVSISWSGDDFEDSIIDCQKRNIKSTSSKIEYDNIFLSRFFIHSVSNCSSCWLINNSEYIKSCNQTGIFCCLSLCVIEICWYCDNCVLNLSSNIGLSDFFHFDQNHGGYFFWRKCF